METQDNHMRKYIILIVETCIVIGVLCAAKFIPSTGIYGLNLTLNIIYNLLIGASAFVACKLLEIQIDFEWKDYKQYIIGFCITIGLLAIVIIFTVCGLRMIGSHTSFDTFEFIFRFFYYLLIIGPVEELVFRIFYQNFFISIFHKHKWIGVIIASLLFGMFHIFSGLVSVLITFTIGLVFGFSKAYIKHLHYPGISLAHGLYDYLLMVARYII